IKPSVGKRAVPSNLFEAFAAEQLDGSRNAVQSHLLADIFALQIGMNHPAGNAELWSLLAFLEQCFKVTRLHRNIRIQVADIIESEFANLFQTQIKSTNFVAEMPARRPLQIYQFDETVLARVTTDQFRCSIR